MEARWEKVNGKCHVSQASKRHTPKSALIGFFFAITEISSMSIIVTLAMSVVSLVLKIGTCDTDVRCGSQT